MTREVSILQAKGLTLTFSLYCLIPLSLSISPGPLFHLSLRPLHFHAYWTIGKFVDNIQRKGNSFCKVFLRGTLVYYKYMHQFTLPHHPFTLPYILLYSPNSLQSRWSSTSCPSSPSRSLLLSPVPSMPVSFLRSVLLAFRWDRAAALSPTSLVQGAAISSSVTWRLPNARAASLSTKATSRGLFPPKRIHHRAQSKINLFQGKKCQGCMICGSSWFFRQTCPRLNNCTSKYTACQFSPNDSR